jgi:hypothetical protein
MEEEMKREKRKIRESYKGREIGGGKIKEERTDSKEGEEEKEN